MKSILVLNAGSSSLKFALYPIENLNEPTVSGQIDRIFTAPRMVAKYASGMSFNAPIECPVLARQRFIIKKLLDLLAAYEIVAVGHRIVHGGEQFSAPVPLDENVLAALDNFVPLAPLHQPHNLRAVRTIAELLPGIPQVGCFDTAFHRTQPAVAQAYAIPRELSAEGIKRYGFHGLSYDYVSRRLPDVLGAYAYGAVIVAHLGSGASMCAMRDRRSVASSMGFTAVDGLMMGTRTGSIDPGVLLYLFDQKGMDVREVQDLLYKESGLLGVSGISADMRELLASDAPEAKEAIDLFCYRAAREIGSLAAAAGGLDALVFTGGIGENSPEIRARICAHCGWLGVSLDARENRENCFRIESLNSRIHVAVIPTDEESMIAQYTVETLGIGK